MALLSRQLNTLAAKKEIKILLTFLIAAGVAVQTDQSSLKLGSCVSDDPYLESDEVSCAHFHFCTGGTRFKLICEDERLYDPSTGYCG